ncbi:MAG: MarR family transcriptional regulator [Eubacteriales bacterium]|nr:MarR family transcriptional regulator [Eubacteriales bacterium]
MEAGLNASYFDVLNKAKKSYARCLEPICKKWGLTRNELDVLLFLYNNPPFDRAADIVSRRGMAKSHVSLSAANLEQQGLLARRFDANDRRTVHLELTDRGRTVAREGRDAQQRFFDQIYGSITAEELELWGKITQKICVNIENFDRSFENP